ncbi:hypothetical protein EDB89DRAFT_1996343 [Lactarius sanguifluus]|nr:hypothetical protein EDB89DRAFT_1996343 [Lactarius sanguifluus]
MVISTTGLGDDPMTVIGHALASRENDGQTDPARKSTDNDVGTRVVALHDREVQVCPIDSALSVRIHTSCDSPPAGASRRSTSSYSRMAIKDAPLPPLQKLIRPNLTPANVTETGTTTRRHRLLGLRKTKTRGDRQLMVYVLIPPFLPGMRKSDYAPVRQRPRDSCTCHRSHLTRCWRHGTRREEEGDKRGGGRMYDEDDEEEEKEARSPGPSTRRWLERSLATQQILTWRRRHRRRPVAVCAVWWRRHALRLQVTARA